MGSKFYDFYYNDKTIINLKASLDFDTILYDALRYFKYFKEGVRLLLYLSCRTKNLHDLQGNLHCKLIVDNFNAPRVVSLVLPNSLQKIH